MKWFVKPSATSERLRNPDGLLLDDPRRLNLSSQSSLSCCALDSLLEAHDEIIMHFTEGKHYKAEDIPTIIRDAVDVPGELLSQLGNAVSSLKLSGPDLMQKGKKVEPIKALVAVSKRTSKWDAPIAAHLKAKEKNEDLTQSEFITE